MGSPAVPVPGSPVPDAPVTDAPVRASAARHRGGVRLLLLGIAVGVLPAAAVATVVLPGAAGLAGRWPWVALIAFRGIVGTALLAASLLPLLVASAVHRYRRLRTVALSLAAVLALGALGELGVLGVRGLTPVDAWAPPPVDGITVVVTNTDHSAADPGALARLILAARADVVAMPETDPTLAAEVAGRLAAGGLRVQVFGVAGQGQITPTTLLVADRLGRYRQVGDTGLGLGEILAVPVGGVAGRPTLVAAHPQAPVSAYWTPVWAASVRAVIATCRDGGDTVLAGDFNSTVDHPALRATGGCSDAARRAGAAAVMTWPQNLPRFFGAALDHVVATTARWRPVAVWVAPIPGSDHRALLTRLRRLGPGAAVTTWAGP